MNETVTDEDVEFSPNATITISFPDGQRQEFEAESFGDYAVVVLGDGYAIWSVALDGFISWYGHLKVARGFAEELQWDRPEYPIVVRRVIAGHGTESDVEYLRAFEQRKLHKDFKYPLANDVALLRGKI